MAEMSARRGLTWSKKWHIVDESKSHDRYDIALCGQYLYNAKKEQVAVYAGKMPEHLVRIINGDAKSTGDCKLCQRSSGVKTVTVELPEPTTTAAATEDENGARSWDYPHGFVIAYDDGTIEWGSWHITDPSKVRAAAAALLAAVDAAEAIHG